MMLSSKTVPLTSHPMWVRGLKRMIIVIGLMVSRVASHVGAWIETLLVIILFETIRPSHPMWVRGLKLSQLVMRLNTKSRIPCGCVD